MEIPIVPKSSLYKAEDPAKVQKPTAAHKAAQAYKTEPSKSDSVDISSKSKLLQKLTKAYDEIEVKQAEKKTLVNVNALSSEEIVHSILRGTLFEIV